MSPKSVLVTGSNRGIGLGFVKRFLELDDPPKHIFATYRNSDNSKVRVLSMRLLVQYL